MDLMNDRGVIFAMIAAVVVLVVFNDMIPGVRRVAPWLARQWRRRRGGSLQVALEMPEQTMERLEALRLECERLAGRPVTFDEMTVNAIETYHTCVVEHEAGSEFFVDKGDGVRTPIELFQKAA